ncbi:MAG: hydrogenase maturation protease [Thermodesulfobacteriota bacterium]
MVREMFDKSTLVFGCGNILFGDDGFGPAVVQYLQENYPLPGDVLVQDAGTSIREMLFDLAISEKKPQKIIIIDAVDYPDRRPGEVFEIPVEGIPAQKTADFSLHQFPTVNLLQELKDHTGVEIHIIVVQVKNLPAEVSPGLSPEVAASIKEVCARILPILGFAYS